jgi:hypothetical protein
VAIREGITPWRAEAALEPAPVAERVTPRAWADGVSPGVIRAAEIAFAIAASWVAAGALVVGIVWAASTLSPKPPTATPAETLPFALAWIAASLTMLGSSVGSTFATARARRRALLRVAGVSGLTLLAFVLAGSALGG